MLSRTSRYAGIAIATTSVNGQPVTHLRRRLVPRAETVPLRSWYTPGRDERSDTIAAATIGDPEQFWQLLDANGSLRDDDILVPGQRLRVPWPAETQVARHA